MNNLVKSFLVCGLAAGIVSPASAVTISVNPSFQSTSVGHEATFELLVSGLGSTQLGAFSVQVNFDQMIAEALSVSYGSGFGNNPLNQFTDLGTLGQVYMSDVADAGFDLSGQGDGFVLGRFTLQGVARGTTLLTIDPSSSLSDADANSLSFTILDGSLNVPDGGNTASLLGLGLLGLGFVRSRFTKAGAATSTLTA